MEHNAEAEIRHMLATIDAYSDSVINNGMMLVRSTMHLDEQIEHLVVVVDRLFSIGEDDKAISILDCMGMYPEVYRYEQVGAYYKIASRMIADGNTDKALYLLSEAMIVTEMMALHWQKAESLSHVALHFYLTGNQESARFIWKKAARIAQLGEHSDNLQDSIDASSVLSEIAEHLYKANFPVDVHGIAEGIKNVGKRNNALQAINELSSKRDS